MAALRHQEKDNPDLKLRVSQATLNAVVESQDLRCTHFDAIRFFHPDARPFNTAAPEPARKTQAADEQPGCVHVHMDLLFFALRLGPFCDSALFAECLGCALEARAVDVRATPYVRRKLRLLLLLLLPLLLLLLLLLLVY